MGKIMKSVSEKFNNLKLKLGKKSQLALAGVLSAVMLIIFINGITSSSNAGKTNIEEKAETSSVLSYNQDLEKRLESIISSIKGVGETEVFVSTETSVETIYATNNEDNKSGENVNSSQTEIVFYKNGSTTTPVVKMEIYPKITGVLVVAEGVDDEKLRLMVINAVAVALDLENSKIEVLMGKSK